jgi:hypothetical protein
VSALTRSEQGAEPAEAPLVLVNGGGAYTFLPPEALAAMEERGSVPVGAPVNGHQVVTDCPYCDGDDGAA